MRVLLAVALAVAVSAQGIDFLEPARIPEEILKVMPNPIDTSRCIDKQLQQCQHGFNWYLNVSGDATADWTNPDTLIHVINNYYRKGTEGVLTLCKARTMFAQCLGSSYKACMNTLKFVDKGQSLQNAHKYVAIMRELEFQCNGGLLQTMSKWDCILGIREKANTDYEKCAQTFENVTTAHPELTCEAAKTFSTCARIPYYIYCGADASWWECERVRISLSLDQQCPTNVCEFHKFAISQPSTLPKHMPHNEKLMNTQHIPQAKLDFIANHAAHMIAKEKAN